MNRYLAAALVSGCLALALPAAPVDEPKPPKPVNLDKVNTRADEDDPHISPDGLHLFWSTNGKASWDLMQSMRTGLMQPWAKGTPLAELNTDVDDRSVFLQTTRGGYPYYLYFATKTDKKINNFDIYMAVKQGPRADFTSPTPINSVDTEADELHPWITATGRELYFSRKTKEGWRVYVASRPGSGAFGEPKLVNLPPNFHHVTLTPDGNAMYVQGPLENDRWGLFHSTRSGATWSMPELLEELHDKDSLTGDLSPCLSRDGTMLYFASDRAGGKGGLDLWVVPTAQLVKKAK